MTGNLDRSSSVMNQMVVSRAPRSSERRLALAFALFAIAFAWLVLTAATAEAGQASRGSFAPMSTDANRPRFPVKLAALRAGDDAPAVGQPGSWFDRRTDGLLKRWWRHSWKIYPASIGSGWGLKLSFRF
jgi:hypothetical protein